MDKKAFINSINFEDKNILSNIYDKICLAEHINQTVFTTEFLPPNVWKTILEMKKNFDISIFTNGIFQDSERRLLAFSKDIPNEYPVKLLKIASSSRFDKLEHKDFLGALMGLGVKREKLGDLIVEEGSCYAAAYDDICEFVRLNLTSVGRSPCSVEVIGDISNINVGYKGELISINSTSLRIDCIVSEICNMSRAKAVDIIRAGKVLVDYCDVIEKDKQVDENSIITIRGYGKYKLLEQLGTTQKGRLRLSVLKYI